MAGTLILFGRSVVLLLSGQDFYVSSWLPLAPAMLGVFSFITMDLAAMVTVKAVLRQDIDVNPMPPRLLREFDSEI